MLLGYCESSKFHELAHYVLLQFGFIICAKDYSSLAVQTNEGKTVKGHENHHQQNALRVGY